MNFFSIENDTSEEKLQKARDEKTKKDYGITSRDIKNKYIDNAIITGDKTSALIANMDFLKSLTVEEHTLYKKWREVQDNIILLNDAQVYKQKIWSPFNINDEKKTIKQIEELNPEIIYVDNESAYSKTWLILRIFGHTMDFSANPGRFLKFLIRDKNSKQYLGVVSLGSDVTSIRTRDEFIGWTRDNKFKEGKLNHTAIANCIMALQPLGYNFLGGKLIASLITTDDIRNVWEENYNEALVGLTTTSLYGSASMYNNIPWWKKLGMSNGLIKIKPDDYVYMEWLRELRENERAMYDKLTGMTSPKQNVINYILRKTGTKTNYSHGYKRGVYFSMFYENGKEFLQNKINESELEIKEKFNRGINGILDWWKPKAINRYKKLLNENRLRPEVFFYDQIANREWDDVKNEYISEVNRGKENLNTTRS